MKITIYLRDDLHTRVKQALPDLNVSAFVALALERELERREKEVAAQVRWAESIYGDTIRGT